jgi:UDP-GlcNAc:undecaprenyl-phosphate/decaprenyl-phosphate GlcNAc-1-phosphate transferase
MLISTLCFGALVVACCSFADRLGRVLGVIDHPDGVRKHHARPTPLVGGIALMVPLLWVALDEALGSGPSNGALFVVLALAAAGFMALGWLDDRHHLPPLARLVISTGLCTLVLLLEPGLQLTVLDLGPLWLPLGLFALPFTLLCLVGLQNAINMADGLNGLVIGLAIFWTSCLLLYAPEPLMPFLSFLLLGLFILLPYNLMGYLFLGDAGSYSLGVIIGLLMIYVYGAAGGALPMATVALWLLIPVLDCLRVMGARLLEGRSPLAGDRNHLHHRLSRHWPWPVSVLVYLAMATGPGLLAALWPAATGGLLVVALGVYGGMLWVTRARTVLALEQRNLPVS